MINPYSASPDNQITRIFDYLSERYLLSGILTQRYSFSWRNISQSNLIAVIPGKNRALPPLVLADHIDTAYCGDIFEGTQQRVSAPGADDNVAASSALLNSVNYLKESTNQTRDIWLMHLTGEEFPADDLGIRRYLSAMMNGNKTDFFGFVVMDMVAYRQPNDWTFQINAGNSEASLWMADLVQQVAKEMTNALYPLQAVVRSRFDPLSYLYNTDGLIISDLGYPVVLINEHINRYENFDRPYYHDSTDLVRTLDRQYGNYLTRIAIESVAQLATLSRPL